MYINNCSKIHVISINVKENKAEEVTGGILINKMKTIDLLDISFENNYAVSGGGALKI